jgi:REP element-mobilizing transposase RayT
MSHSFTNLLYHLVFATKERRPWLSDALRPGLYAYLGGVVRELGGIALEINGVADHVHVLAKLRPDGRLSDVLRELKAGSSAWVKKADAAPEAFAWQNGYGAFTVSHSQVETVRRYIQNQEEHHRTVSFDEEMRRFIRAHGLAADEKELWE